MAFDTDVNAAALAELRHGVGQGLDSLVYLTIGTGFGGGAVVGGRLVHGLAHPEIGHMPIPRGPQEVAAFPGVCPYHGDCLEGVAAGPAIAARWGAPGPELPADHPAWDLEADYLASALATLVYVLSPQRIVIGGGVGSVPHLLERVRPRLVELIAGYILHPALQAGGARSYLVHPSLGDRAGLIGAFGLVAGHVRP
jgi:fructokinase